MLRFMRRSSRWVMWIVIIGVGAVFVLYLGIGGITGGAAEPDTVVAVAGRSYDTRDVLRVRQNQEAQLRENLGDAYDAEAASDFLNQNAATMLLRQALLAREAERMGLTVSDAEVRGYLRGLPGAANEQGRLQREVITAYAERNFGSLRRFQDALRDEILAAKASRRIQEAAAVSEAEVRGALRQERTEVRIAAVVLDAEELQERTEVPDEAVERLLAEEAERVRQAYEARSDEFDRPEQVRARHILVKVPRDAPEEEVEAARARIQEIRERVAGGADFADVALEVSEDPGSQARGGDLGFFSRGSMVPGFEEVAFQLEPGVLSEPVRSASGFHLIRVEEKRAARVVPFDEAQREVAHDLAVQDLAREAARSRAEELAAAVREGSSLVEAARAREIPIRRPDAFRWSPDGRVPDVGAAPDVMSTALALREDASSDPRIHQVEPGRYVLVQLLERTEPAAEALAEAIPERREALLQERRNRIEQAWLTEARDTLQDEGRLVFDLSELRS